MRFAVYRQPLCPAWLHRSGALRLGFAQVLEIAAFGQNLGPRAPFGGRPLLLNPVEVLRRISKTLRFSLAQASSPRSAARLLTPSFRPRRWAAGRRTLRASLGRMARRADLLASLRAVHAILPRFAPEPLICSLAAALVTRQFHASTYQPCGSLDLAYARCHSAPLEPIRTTGIL